MRSSRSTRGARSVLETMVPTVIAAVALTIGLGGCPDKKPKYPTCEKDSHCKKGEVCVDKKCVQCGDDDDCPDGQLCRNNACVGQNWCASDSDCTDGKVCKNNECVACESDGECGANGRCADGKCLRPGDCTKDEDCADDEDCIDGKCKGYGGGNFNAQCTLHTIYFEFDAAGIQPEMKDLLTQTAECLNSTERGVYVIGHTDPRGTEEYNIALSEGRARGVADYLARLGIDPARMRIVPKGETESTGADESSWKQDRRVEFEWQ